MKLYLRQSFSLKSSAHRSLGRVLHRPIACERDVLSVLLTQLVLPQGIRGLGAYTEGSQAEEHRHVQKTSAKETPTACRTVGRAEVTRPTVCGRHTPHSAELHTHNAWGKLSPACP